MAQRRGGTIAAGILCALLGSAASGCSPTLRSYVEHLDSDGPIYAAAVVEPPRSPTPVVPKSVVLCRFKDERSFGERNHVGAAIADSLAAVLSLGVAALSDARHPEDRNQPMIGLEDDLPRRIANYASSAGTFTSCSFVDRAQSTVFERPSRKERATSADVVLSGEVREFRGTFDVAPKESGSPAPTGVVNVKHHRADDCRGRIVVELTAADAKSGATLWSEVVAVDEDVGGKVGELDEYSETTLSNKLVVAALGAFLARVDDTYRTKLRDAVAPAAPPTATALPPKN